MVPRAKEREAPKDQAKEAPRARVKAAPRAAPKDQAKEAPRAKAREAPKADRANMVAMTRAAVSTKRSVAMAENWSAQRAATLETPVQTASTSASHGAKRHQKDRTVLPFIV